MKLQPTRNYLRQTSRFAELSRMDCMRHALSMRSLMLCIRQAEGSVALSWRWPFGAGNLILHKLSRGALHTCRSVSFCICVLCKLDSGTNVPPYDPAGILSERPTQTPRRIVQLELPQAADSSQFRPALTVLVLPARTGSVFGRTCASWPDLPSKSRIRSCRAFRTCLTWTAQTGTALKVTAPSARPDVVLPRARQKLLTAAAVLSLATGLCKAALTLDSRHTL